MIARAAVTLADLKVLAKKIDDLHSLLASLQTAPRIGSRPNLTNWRHVS